MIKSKCQSAIKVLNAYGSLIAIFEENDCFVYALGCAFDLPYHKAHKIARTKFNRQIGHGVKPVPIFKIFRNMFEINSKTINNKSVLDIMIKPKKITEINGETKERLYNVGQFSQNFSVGTYIIFVNGHCLAIKDGVIIDKQKNFSLRCLVKRAYKIGEKENIVITDANNYEMAA
jgi:hypothetical protein